jgi:hypothetical protein
MDKLLSLFNELWECLYLLDRGKLNPNNVYVQGLLWSSSSRWDEKDTNQKEQAIPAGSNT